MAREVTWGTPRRKAEYQRARRGRALLRNALLLGFALAATLVGAQALGVRGLLSPGTLTSGHAPIAQRCVECHSPGVGTTDARCERCHDAAASSRLTHAAHTGAGADAARGEHAGLSCETCHREHRGADARLTEVRNAVCARCHFGRFSAHPEFSVVRRQSGESPGIRFDHATHVPEAAQAFGGGPSGVCTRCHEPAAATRDLAPISFERHCAACHAAEGSLGGTEALLAADLLLPQPLPEDFAREGARIRKTSVAHEDAWILQNWRALRRELDPAATGAERDALIAEKARVEAQLGRIGRAAPGSEPPPPVLTLGPRRELEQALADVEARLAAMAGAASASRPLAPAEQERKRAALQALSKPCLVCHQTSAAGELLPAQGARRVMTGSTFAHSPHLLFGACADCHAGVAQSARADEIHAPGVAACRGCHGAGGVADGCQACHVYHRGAAP
jgi:predicted CXXCH cytochrome family protein